MRLRVLVLNLLISIFCININSYALGPVDAEETASMNTCSAQATAYTGSIEGVNAAVTTQALSMSMTGAVAQGHLCTLAITAVGAALTKCASAAKLAGGACIESLSPNIQTVIPVLSLGMAAMSTVQSMSEACAKQSELMKIAGDAGLAYNAACGGTKLMCDSSCGSVLTNLATAHHECMPFTNIWVASASQGKAAMAVCTKSCGKYALNLAAGAAGLIQMIESGKEGKNCNNAATSTVTTTAPAINCSPGGPNASSVACICQANPSACQNGTPVTGVNAASGAPPLAGSNAQTNGQSMSGNAGAGSGSSSAGTGSAGGGAGSPTASGIPSSSPVTAIGAKGVHSAGATQTIGADGTGNSFSSGAAGFNQEAGSAIPKTGTPNLASYARKPASEVAGKASSSNWARIGNVYSNMAPGLLK